MTLDNPKPQPTEQHYFSRYSQLVQHRIIEGHTKLFAHQRTALLKLWEKAARGELDPNRRTPNSGAGYILAGVGCGKTVIISCLPYILGEYMSGKQVIVVVDNCTLRSRILQDFPTDSRHCPIYDQWPIYSLGVLPDGVPPPQIAELRAEEFRSYAFSLDSADILVVNRQFLVNLVNRGDLNPANVGLILIDEAHHASASSYRSVINYFSDSLLCFFTGSRFRSDHLPIPHIRYSSIEDETESGQLVTRYTPVADFEFSLQQAWKLNPTPIKRLVYQEAVSKGFVVEEEGGREIEYSPEAFFAKAESDREWFRKILLADIFCLPVLAKAVEVLALKRQGGKPHAMIVRGLNIPHSHRLYQLLSTFPLLEGRVGLVHSDREGFDLAGRPSETYKRFFSGEYIALVHCGMVSEGFSHPWASVSVCLGVMRSLTVAEQEFGRIIRRVPGSDPGHFPDIAHDNWGVVVSHEALGIGDIFQQFLDGMPTAPLTGYWDGDDGEWSAPKNVPKPELVRGYSAGETTITLSDASSLEAGDLIVLSTPQIEETVVRDISPKFDLAAELRSTGHLTYEPGVEDSNSSQMQEFLPEAVIQNGANGSQSALSFTPMVQPEPLKSIQDRACDLIAERMKELRNSQVVSVRIEAVLDDKTVQISPAWIDLPVGTDLVKKPVRRDRLESKANFVSHVGLDWLVLYEGELIKYSEYRKKAVLKSKGLDIDRAGRIVTDGGARLADVMPPGTYEFFLKGLESEIATAEVPIQNPTVSCRPDEVKKSLQAEYGQKVRSLVFELLREPGLIRDGGNGSSLVAAPVPSLVSVWKPVPSEGVEQDDNEPGDYRFRNNSELLHKAVFASIKQTTGKKWAEHSGADEYESAYRCGVEYIRSLRIEILANTSW